MQKVLHINADKCTGCLQCEMACSYENYGVFAPAKSRIKVFDFHETGKKVPYTCTQCDEAWCMSSCPTEAIKVDAATGGHGHDGADGLLRPALGHRAAGGQEREQHPCTCVDLAEEPPETAIHGLRPSSPCGRSISTRIRRY